MSTQETTTSLDLWGNAEKATVAPKKNGGKAKTGTQGNRPSNKTHKPSKMTVPDFADPHRPLTCLEADFPIAQINALSNLEGNAGKPIYQMSKWWARRRSSVFRALLLAAAIQSPDDPNEAAKLIWEQYYRNHQTTGSFKHLKVLDCFMGGGTTLVEGARLGMQMTGIDINPVAWFVVRNELACSDPEQVKALFEEIECQVKPQIQPLYTTTCPRGHQGQWVDVRTGKTADADPLDLPLDQRANYRWEGPEVIYTFWAKHGTCQAMGCGHRTPIFRSPVIAEKHLSTKYLALTCPSCGLPFHAELGETRMAPGVERIIVDGDTPFTELTQCFAQLLHTYDKGKAPETWERAKALLTAAPQEHGLCCPQCGAFAAEKFVATLKNHADPKTSAAKRKKKAFGLQRKTVQMYLLIHPDWLQGTAGCDDGQEMGGWAGAPVDASAAWYQTRLRNLRLIEVRGATLPDKITLADGTVMDTAKGTVPRQAYFTCAACGRENNTLESTRPTQHTPPVAAYVLQCHCPQCEAEGYMYGGRYFKAPDAYDDKRLAAAEKEWANRSESDLTAYWPRQICWDAYMMRANGGVNDGWGYTHWWKMFHPRQLLVHTQLLKAISEASDKAWPLDVREQALGAFQQYLRMMSMFSFWHQTYDKLAPSLSNANFHPKNLIVETSVLVL